MNCDYARTGQRRRERHRRIVDAAGTALERSSLGGAGYTRSAPARPVVHQGH